jgi:excisionase family DNA binding protein
MESSRSAKRKRSLVSTVEVADQLDVSTKTVEYWRMTGTGPPYHRVGRHVRYDQADVDRWLADHFVVPGDHR